MFRAVGIKLVDFKIEYGKTWNKDREKNEIVLADEISPDTCRLWDAKTEKKLTKIGLEKIWKHNSSLSGSCKKIRDNARKQI